MVFRCCRVALAADSIEEVIRKNLRLGGKPREFPVFAVRRRELGVKYRTESSKLR